MAEGQGTPTPVYQFHPALNSDSRHNIPTRSIESVQPIQEIKLNQSLLKGLGITQIAIGVACAILNIILLVIKADDIYEHRRSPESNVSNGIWGGALILVAGILQLLLAKKSLNKSLTKSLIVGTMVLSIIATCASVVIVALGVMEVMWGFLAVQPEDMVSITLGSIMAILGFLEVVLSILSSALCCYAGTKMAELQGIPTLIYQFHPVLNTGFPHNMIESVQPFQKIKFNQLLLKGLGITQISIGAACAIINITLFVIKVNDSDDYYYYYYYYYFPLAKVCYGIWGGALILVAGILQLLLAKKSLNKSLTKSLIVGTMVMSIIAACASVVIVALGITEALRQSNSPRPKDIACATFGSTMAILGLVEGVLSTLSSVLCCKAVCCIPFNPIVRFQGFAVAPGQHPYQHLYEPIPRVPPSPYPIFEVPQAAGVAQC